MPNAGNSIAYKTLAPGTDVPTIAPYELSTQVASTTFSAGHLVAFSATTGTVGCPITAAATTAAVTNGFLGMALADATGTNVTASTAKRIPIACASPNTLFAFPFAAGTGTAFATTSTVPRVGVSYIMGFGTPSGGAIQNYVDTTVVTNAAVATTTTLTGTVYEVETGGTYSRVWVRLTGPNVDNLVR